MSDLVVIPCGGAKLDTLAPARELYVGAQFRLGLQAALALQDADPAARVVILSARHGLVQLDQQLQPYDVAARDLSAAAFARLSAIVAHQLRQLDAVDQVDRVVALTPKAYSTVLRLALPALDRRPASDRHAVLVDVLAGSRGLLDQRARLARVKRDSQLVTSW